MELGHLLTMAMATGAYLGQEDGMVESAMRQAVDWILACDVETELGLEEIGDEWLGSVSVVVARFGVAVPWESDLVAVRGIVEFDPRFPKSPPIFGVRDDRKNGWLVKDSLKNARFAHDGFKIDLKSVKSWPDRVNFEDLFSEFCQNLSTNFPYTPSPKGTSRLPSLGSHQPERPSIGDSRDASISTPTARGSVSPNPRTDGSRDSRAIPFSRTSSNTASLVTWNQPSEMSIRDSLRKIKSEFLEETRETYAAVEFLFLKKKEIGQKEAEVRAKTEALGAQLVALKKEEADFRGKVDQLLATKNKKAIDFVDFESPKDQKRAHLVAESLALSDLEGFLEDSFFLDDRIELDQHLTVALGTWRKQFDNFLASKGL